MKCKILCHRSTKKSFKCTVEFNFLIINECTRVKKAHSEVTKSWHMHLQVATNFLNSSLSVRKKLKLHPLSYQPQVEIFHFPDKINFFGRKFHQSQWARRIWVIFCSLAWTELNHLIDTFSFFFHRIAFHCLQYKLEKVSCLR